MARVATTTVILLVILVGGVLLQIFLSRRESRWPGLVLPGIQFLFSLVALLNVADLGSPGEVLAAMLAAFVSYNIPTLVLLAIYFACRDRRKKLAELEKMKISDL